MFGTQVKRHLHILQQSFKCSISYFSRFLFNFTEKGFCVPTVFLWLLFVYIEASIRLKEFKAHLDLKHLPFHLDLCRPFAAHCIGYPVVTLGFGFKSYVGFRMRLRRQKEVQKENEYYYEFLREALPPGPVRDEAFNVNPQPSPKANSEDRISADGSAIAPATPIAAALSGNHGGGAGSGSGSSSALSNMDLLSPSVSSSSLPPSSMTLMNNGNDSNGSLNGSIISSIAGLANGKHHHNGDLAHLATSKLANLAGSSVSNGSLNNNAHGSHGELDYMEKMHRADEPDMEAEKAASKGRPKPPVTLAMLEDHETLLERDEPLAPATTKKSSSAKWSLTTRNLRLTSSSPGTKKTTCVTKLYLT